MKECDWDNCNTKPSAEHYLLTFLSITSHINPKRPAWGDVSPSSTHREPNIGKTHLPPLLLSALCHMLKVLCLLWSVSETR